MKAKEFDIKKRNPNWRAMQDIRRSGAGGVHKDLKKAEKQGDVKHKKQAVPMESIVSEDLSNYTDAGIPAEFAKNILRKFQINHDAEISPVPGKPKTSDIENGDMIINVLPGDNVVAVLKRREYPRFSASYTLYHRLTLIDGEFKSATDTSVAAATKGMAARGKFFRISSEHLRYADSPRRGEKPTDDEVKDRSTQDPLAGSSYDIYSYMNDTFMPRMRSQMEAMVDDIYANLRKLDKNKDQWGGERSRLSKNQQEVALEAASIIEQIAKDGFTRNTMERFLSTFDKSHHGFASIPNNERELKNLLKTEPNARAKWAKTVLDAAKEEHRRVKEMVAAPVMKALRGEGVAEGENLELYGLRIGDTVTAKIDGQRVQGDIIDIYPEDMEVELFLRGPETGRTVVVDVRDTEIVEATGDEKFDTMMRTIKKGTKKQTTADRRERETDSRQRARDAFGPSPADKLSIRPDKDVEEGLTTEKQILTRIRQIMYDRKLSGTESNAGELLRLKQQLKDLRSQQSVSEGDEPDEGYLDKVISDLHKDALGMRPDQEFGREWMSSSYEEKLEIYNNMLKNLHSDLDEDYKDRLRQMRQNTQDKLAGMRSNTQSTLGRLSGRDKPASSANDKKTPKVGDKIEFGQFNKPASMKTATVIKVGGGGMSLVVKTDDGKEGTINLGNKSLTYKIIEDSDAITQNLPFGSVRLPKPDPVSSQQVITQRPGGEKEKENMPPKIKRLWDRIKQKPNVYVEVMNIIDEFDTLRDDEIEDEIKAFLGSDELIMRAVGIVLQYEYEKMKNESISENSDWGEPRDILEDVLQTLEREVEWPLSEVMEPREFRPLLSALVRAVNDKLLSMDRDGNQ